MFDLTFLGTSATVPSPERGLPALHVARGPHRFLVDCGEGTTRQLMRAGLGFRGLGHVLLTHAHLDHIAGLAGLVATRALFGLDEPVELIGSDETAAFVGRHLAATVGAERRGGYRLSAIGPGPVLAGGGWRLGAFPVVHRGTESLGWRFADDPRHPLIPERLAALGVPEGAARRALAAGSAVTLADGREITPQMVRGAVSSGAGVAIVGDTEEVATLVEPVRGADLLVIEATFLERDVELARRRGHLTAAAAGWLAREADIGELRLTHISGRYPAEEITAEAGRFFADVQVVADFERIAVRARAAVAKESQIG